MSIESTANLPDETSAEETAEVVESTQEAQEEPKAKTKDYNFRKMEQKMRDLEEKLRQNEMRKSAPQEEEMDDTDIMTVGEYRKQREKDRQALEESMKQRELSTLQDRLNSKYSDYNDVVSEDAVEDLRDQHPELYNSLRANPDPYQKAVAAYKLIKNMRGPEKSNERNAKANQKKIEENRSKPNVAATSASVLSQATGWTKMTKEQKAQVYQDMKAAAQRRG